MDDSPAYRQIGVIGAGRVAQALALGLGPHSAAPPLLWGRSPDALHAAVGAIGRAKVAADCATLVQASDLIVIAVSDDAVGAVAADIAPMLPAMYAPFVFHVSGRCGAAVLHPLHAKGAVTAAIHPAMTFTGDPQNEVRRMAGARFAITGPGEDAIRGARHVVRLLGGVPVEIPEAQRALYHAALCHAANHLVTLLAGSARALTAAGVDDPLPLLAPLVRAALENSLAQGFAALSGPLLRGDEDTIRNHMAALNSGCPEMLPAYRAMALATLDELERTGAASPPAALRRDLA